MAMSSGRPGGLTTMAVMNFIIVGWYGLVSIGLVFMLARPGHPGREEMSTTEMCVALAIVIVSAVLLLLSGIGYLRQLRFLGWMLGLLYGVIGLATQIVELTILDREIGIGHVIGMLYPLETLFFLLFVFRRDFHS